MNSIISMFWQLAKNVIITKQHTYVFCFLSLIATFAVRGQKTISDGYEIVPRVISKDTLPDKYALRLLHKKIVSGKITKEDSLNFVAGLKTKPLLLIRNAKNKYAQERLAEQYLDNKEIAKYIGREQLLEVIDRIGPDSNHPKNLEKKGIKIIDEKPKTKSHHYFSAPLFIEEKKYIIYHFKSIGTRVGKSEFIIYCYNENLEIEIEKTFVLWEH